MFCCCCRNDIAALEDDAESILEQRPEARKPNGEKNKRIEDTDVDGRTAHANRILDGMHTWCIPETHVKSLETLNELINVQDKKCVVDVKRLFIWEVELRSLNKTRKQNQGQHWGQELENNEEQVMFNLSYMLRHLKDFWPDQYRPIVSERLDKKLGINLSTRVPSRRASTPNPTIAGTSSGGRRGSR
jgi:hypothetical protein